jgi:hypothetical protein
MKHGTDAKVSLGFENLLSQSIPIELMPAPFLILQRTFTVGCYAAPPALGLDGRTRTGSTPGLGLWNFITSSRLCISASLR